MCETKYELFLKGLLIEGNKLTQTQLSTFLKSNTGVTHLLMTEPSLQIRQFSQRTLCLPTLFYLSASGGRLTLLLAACVFQAT